MVDNHTILKKLKQRAGALKSQSHVLYLAYRHPDTPWYAKVFAGLVAAYAFSPIDLIPDFIPVFGYLDDLLLIPLGVTLALKMIPAEVIDVCQAEVEALIADGKPVSRAAGMVIILVWLGVLIWVVTWVVKL